MKGCQTCGDSLWLNGKPCPNREHYYRPKGKTVFTNGKYREREHMGNRKSRPGAPDLRKNKDKGSWSKLALIMAIFLTGCNTDTYNILWPTYEYQHQGRTRAQEHEFLKKTYPNDPGLWQ